MSGNLHCGTAHAPEQGIEVPLPGEQRTERVVQFIRCLEILVIALFMSGSRGNLVHHDSVPCIVLVHVVAVRNQDRFYCK